MPARRGYGDDTSTGRAAQLQEILRKAVPELTNFVHEAEEEKARHNGTISAQNSSNQSSLVNPASSSRNGLEHLLAHTLTLSEQGSGDEGLQELLKTILTYSVNPSAPGFLDKLYAAPLPPGIVAELILGVLNTNAHVYQVSPVLTLIEKHTTRKLAHMFGLTEPRSGGISVQGGSASNMTSIVIARNTLFPETKVHGNSAVKGRLVLFTSAHGHYSIEKAAQALGLGSSSVITVPVDSNGCMLTSELDRLVAMAKEEGNCPFYVNATAGSTVLGSFDPFEEIYEVTKKHNLWLHVDGAWGGGFVFSERPQIKNKLRGIGLADSIATNPHKMLGVPMTCSFLLAKDLRQFQEANTLKAGYLFHDNDDGPEDEPEDGDEQQSTKAKDETAQSIGVVDCTTDRACHEPETRHWEEPYDLADLTLQCGRRGDSLKFFLSWKFYGTDGYATMVDDAFDVACYTKLLVEKEPELTPVLAKDNDPSCLQVCFYYTPNGKFAYELFHQTGRSTNTKDRIDDSRRHASEQSQKARLGRLNTKVTTSIAKALIPKGFMIDFAPALPRQEDRGSFFRVVVNISTTRATMERLIHELVLVGSSIKANMGASGEHRDSAT